MNLKKIAWAAGVLAVLILIFGVWASYAKPATLPAATQPDILGGTKTATGDYQYSEDKPYYTITADYPGQTPLPDADADAKARATIEQGLSDEITQFESDNQLDTMTAADAQTQGITSDRKYTLDMEYKSYTSSSSVSYAYTVYADTLGAHPNGYYLTFVFDNAGTQAKLSDLFAPGADYLTPIAAAAKAQVEAQLEAELGQSDVGGDIFADGLAPTDENFQNFVIDGDNLVIFIPPYQAAAYAAGSFEVTVPLASLSDLLAPGVI